MTTWWTDAVGYEIYVRSYADSDGDGIGDLAGTTAHLDHLAWLGVEVVWITPFYPSPMADFGYDVADYRAVDPRFGDLAAFDELVAEAHRLDLRVVIDLVPNHTSDQHAWFQRALADPSSPERRRYIFRDPAPGGGPPNNWRSHFGGPAWTRPPGDDQYYLHLFLPEQPDLDWANPEVGDEFESILRFWLDRGADGFRIDVAHSLAKNPDLPDNPILADVDEDAPPRTRFRAMDHRHDLDQPGVIDIYRRWRQVTDEYGAVLLGEVYLDDPIAVGRYVGDDRLHLSFYFPVLHTPWDAAALREVIEEGLEEGRGAIAWVLSSHDDDRPVTRFGGGDRGRRRSLAALTALAFLPGPVFLYQGDELGLANTTLDPGDLRDPVAVRNADPSDGRDPVRTPMPWTAEPPHFGFTEGTPWLPLGREREPGESVAAQRSDDASHLSAVRRLLACRRAHRPLTDTFAVDWLDLADGVVAFARGDVLVALNAGAAPCPVPIGLGQRVLFSTVDVGGDDGDGASSVDLPPDAAIVVGRATVE